MLFKTLEDKCLYYRSLTDYKLVPNSYVIVMLDGRSFSKNIKNKMEKPFDNDFIRIMNETAEYLCKNIQGCKIGYVQSDEISLVLTDIEGEIFFGGRLCKIQGIVASMATAKFNALMHKFMTESDPDSEYPMFQFDCKAWNVPNVNDAYAWLLFRQNDCIKNSKQQFAQTYCTHKQLHGKNTDEQVSYCQEVTGYDWHTISDGKKYGRFIFKSTVPMSTYVPAVKKTVVFNRSVWASIDGRRLNEDGKKFLSDNVEIFKELVKE